MKAQYRSDDELPYYSYILSNADGILCTHHDSDDVLNKWNGYVPLKPRSVGSPDMYLGTKLKCMQLHNVIWAWSMSPSKYVQEAVRICMEYVARHLSKDYVLPKRADNPFESGYSPKLDVSPVLGPEEASYYKPLIGVMRWMIEIERIDINTEVSPFSSYSAMLRQGHLEAVLHIMGYLKLRHNSRLMFDPSYPNIDHSNFWDCDWTDFYEGAV